MDDEDIRQEKDGTWTIDLDYGDVKPLHGIPTLKLAREILDRMWQMDREGARSAMYEF